MQTPKALKLAATGVAALAVAILLAGILYVPYSFAQPPSGADQPRVHYNTKNSTRFTGANAAEIGAVVARALYPATTDVNRPDVIILYREHDWQAGLQATPLLRPLRAVLLPDTIDPQVLTDLNPARSRVLSGAQVLLLGEAVAPVGDFTVGQLGPAQIAPLLEAAGAAPRHAVLVDAADPATALLVAPWAAYSGDLVVFDRTAVPPNLPINVMADLAGGTPAATAVAFAQHDDPALPLFGWGMNAESLTGYRGYVIAPHGDWATGLLSANLAVRGKPGPLFWTEAERLPHAVNNYFFSQRAAFWVTPSEGPFHHFNILGDTAAVSFPAQSQADYAVEIGPYKLKGYAMGPLDMLGAVWVLLGMASALWIAVHEAKFLPRQNWIMRLAWPLLAFMIGPFGIPLYYLAYRRPIVRPQMDGDREMIVWDRPLWLQGLAATASAVGFGALFMVAGGYVVTLFGMPLMPLQGPLFLLGTPMILVMVINYVVAVLLAWPLFQTPMISMFYGISYGQALWKALPLVLLSMAAAALAMDPGMWYYMMSNMPMMPMEESISWFGVMFFTVFLAFLMAWPLNTFLVHRQRKSGVM